jgi:hypothetical protein
MGDRVTPTPVTSAAERVTASGPPNGGDGPCDADSVFPSPRVAVTERGDAGRTSRLLAENEALRYKLTEISRVIRGLAADLATSRRDCRRKQREIDSLRAENASLAVAAAATGNEASRAEFARLEAECQLNVRCRPREEGLASLSPEAVSPQSGDLAPIEQVDDLEAGRFLGAAGR